MQISTGDSVDLFLLFQLVWRLSEFAFLVRFTSVAALFILSNLLEVGIMAFKRMEGFAGSVPQKFADQRIPKCPMCGTNNPHWSIDERMGNMFSFNPEENAHQKHIPSFQENPKSSEPE